ncbi:serine/threonine protein kinase [Micromonospora echinofusca]|uniref:serine/threonine protein kinase n=1 Tax=Micromonospora echinofusca TaxID=47858 RepID=UPI001AD64616|nr:serine/threonine protein kinase [Micromonospora echinofusca]
MRLADAIHLVTRAADDELFGRADPHRRYRQLAAVLHPDRTGHVDETQRAAATAAFVTLTTRWQAYGSTTVNGYTLGSPAYSGDLADLYRLDDDRLLKLPRDPANNDLMLREQVALRRIERDGDPRYLPYVPRLVESFRHRDDSTGAEHRVSVLAAVPGLHSLAEVRRRRPDGLDPRDAAWMWRRLLVALGLAHRAGVVHGAVLPDHVLIEPDAHGVVLVDWCYSVADPGDTVPAVVPAYADWYPVEVRDRRPPGPGTDLAMAATCMVTLMGDRAPAALRSFADGCRTTRPESRPDDAWRLLGELDDVLERLYGPRTFRPFHL